MAQQEEELATKRDNLSSIPRTHVVERESRFLQVVLWLPLCAMTYPPTHTPCHPDDSSVL